MYQDEKLCAAEDKAHKDKDLTKKLEDLSQEIAAKDKSSASGGRSDRLAERNDSFGQTEGRPCIRAPQSMQVKGSVGGWPLLVLIDSRSTHNFVDEALEEQLRAPVDQWDIPQVLVANGERVCNLDKWKKSQLQLGNQKFNIEYLCYLVWI
ncbi:conserved hypothetical protein [Ricinus communis]|uniref:Uncharacterized protein n=1 Tax=Ricinus communis TaxID=3988 RepID=B9S4J0_RICCO|nr:conserved hypothetical protein [Ricinus communis]